jgi:hypothetical protein
VVLISSEFLTVLVVACVVGDRAASALQQAGQQPASAAPETAKQPGSVRLFQDTFYIAHTGSASYLPLPSHSQEFVAFIGL